MCYTFTAIKLPVHCVVATKRGHHYQFNSANNPQDVKKVGFLNNCAGANCCSVTLKKGTGSLGVKVISYKLNVLHSVCTFGGTGIHK